MILDVTLIQFSILPGVQIHLSQAQTAGEGAVEYTDCTSAEGARPPPTNECPDDESKNLMMRL